MEIETTVHEISGSFFVRIPANMADFLKLKSKDKAKIKDLSSNEVEIKFKLW